MKPRACSLATVDAQVRAVLDLDDGRILGHEQVIGNDAARASRLRLMLRARLAAGEPRLACAECAVPVYLACLRVDGQARFFFRHVVEDGSCSASTRGRLSQREIDALRYDGLKEGRLHRWVKQHLAAALAADPGFTDVEVEARWSSADGRRWRRPDVRATRDGRRVAFEIQVSNTYLNVVAERRAFYLRENALLVWVFAGFAGLSRRLLHDDLFYNNNHNAFAFDPEALQRSLETSRLHLRCIWSEAPPSQSLRSALVAFDNLTLDAVNQRVYHHDFDGDCDALRGLFEARWIAHGAAGDEAGWRDLGRRLEALGIDLPARLTPSLRGHLIALYSAKHGRPCGWKLRKLVEATMRIADAYPSSLWVLRRALRAYGRGPMLVEQDRLGAWRQRVLRYRARMRSGDPACAHDPAHDALLAFLAPEVFDDLAPRPRTSPAPPESICADERLPRLQPPRAAGSQNVTLSPVRDE